MVGTVDSNLEGLKGGNDENESGVKVCWSKLLKNGDGSCGMAGDCF